MHRKFPIPLAPAIFLALTICLALTSAVAVAAAEDLLTILPTDGKGEIVVAAERLAPLEDAGADAAPAIQGAIDRIARAGGGVLYLSNGIYRLDEPLRVREGVTVRGDLPWVPTVWPATALDIPTGGATLAIYGGRGEEDGAPSITLERGAAVRNLLIWHPEQNAEAPVPYPWTIRSCSQMDGNNTTVMNVGLINPWQAIRIGPEWNELHTIRNVWGTPLKTGFWNDFCTDIGRIINVSFSPSYWERSGLPGAPTSDGARAALRRHLAEHATAVEIGRSDWEYIYRLYVEGYATGVRFFDGERGQTNAVIVASVIEEGGTALRLEALNHVGLAVSYSRLMGSEAAVHTLPTMNGVVQLYHCDIIGAADHPAVVLEGPGSALFALCRFSGVSDNPSILAQAGLVSAVQCEYPEAGGAIVLTGDLRAVRLVSPRHPEIQTDGVAHPDRVIVEQADLAHLGRYGGAPAFAFPDQEPMPPTVPTERVLSVTDFGASPEANDNTAAFGRALAAAAEADGAIVYVPAGAYRFAGSLTVPTGVELRGVFDAPHHTVSGGSTLMPLGGRGEADGAPFIQMEAESGMRGVTIWYPEQSTQDMAPYPWAIRSLGPRCYLVYVTIGNAWRGVDFASHPSDGHFITYLAGAMFDQGLRIGQSGGGGYVEDLQFNPHYSARVHSSLPRRRGGSFEELMDVMRQNLRGIVIHDAVDQRLVRNFLYAARDGLAFTGPQGGSGAEVIMHGSDTCSRSLFLGDIGGTTVRLINPQLVPLSRFEVAAIVTDRAYAGDALLANAQLWAGDHSALLEGKGTVRLVNFNTTSGDVRARGGQLRLTNGLFQRDMDAHITLEASIGDTQIETTFNLHGPLKIDNQAGEKARLRWNDGAPTAGQ